jgi:hypothetical protein
MAPCGAILFRSHEHAEAAATDTLHRFWSGRQAAADILVHRKSRRTASRFPNWSITARRPASKRRSWLWLPLLAHSRILAATKLRAAVDRAGMWLQTSSRTLRIAATVSGSNLLIVTPLTNHRSLAARGYGFGPVEHIKNNIAFRTNRGVRISDMTRSHQRTRGKRTADPGLSRVQERSADGYCLAASMQMNAISWSCRPDV